MLHQNHRIRELLGNAMLIQFPTLYAHSKPSQPLQSRGWSSCLVLTHHAPIVEGASDPKFSHSNNPTLSGFVTDMLTPITGVDFTGKPRERGVLLGPPLHTWAFGHTHWCCDFSLKGKHSIRLVSIQRGYKSGMQDCALSFNREFVLGL